VTGSQWWRMWQHHGTMVRSMSEFLIQWGREHSRWFSFFWRREAWECSRFSVFLTFPGPKKGPLSKVNALIIIPYNDTWAARGR
jgi:hypothetical protein